VIVVVKIDLSSSIKLWLVNFYNYNHLHTTFMLL